MPKLSLLLPPDNREPWLPTDLVQPLSPKSYSSWSNRSRDPIVLLRPVPLNSLFGKNLVLEAILQLKEFTRDC